MLLEARGLHKSFGGIAAVNDVTFAVSGHEVLGVIGANGSGKTTCLNILSRLVDADQGTMKIDGRDYTRTAAHKLTSFGISRTFQNLRLLRDFSVHENIALGAQSRHLMMNEREIRTRVDGLLELGGIRDCGPLLPASLPYGTQRVVEILRALATSPRLVFLDEPFAGMSAEEARSICDLLLNVRASTDMALVIVDHNVEVLAGVAERLIALAEGKLISDGHPSIVLSNASVIRSYIGSDG